MWLLSDTQRAFTLRACLHLPAVTHRHGPLDELMGRFREAIGLCLDGDDGKVEQFDFVGVERVTV